MLHQSSNLWFANQFRFLVQLWLVTMELTPIHRMYSSNHWWQKQGVICHRVVWIAWWNKRNGFASSIINNQSLECTGFMVTHLRSVMSVTLYNSGYQSVARNVNASREIKLPCLIKWQDLNKSKYSWGKNFVTKQLAHWKLSDLRLRTVLAQFLLQLLPGRELIADQCDLPAVCLKYENWTSFWYNCRWFQSSKLVRKSTVSIT